MKSRGFAEVAVGAVVLLVATGFLLFAVTSSGRSLMAPDGIHLRAKFDRIDGIAVGADVRMAGVRVGSVTEARIEPETFLAVLTLRVDAVLRLPSDTSAEIQSEGLLGGRFVSLVPGGSERVLTNGQTIANTQGAVSLESLLGRFIFSVTELNARGGQPQPQQGTPSVPGGQGTPR